VKRKQVGGEKEKSGGKQREFKYKEKKEREGDRESLKTERKGRDGGGRPKTERVEGDGES
jgi:hypothetical protein